MDEKDYQKNAESEETINDTSENSSLEIDFSEEPEVKKAGARKKIIIGLIVVGIVVACIAGLALGAGKQTDESAKGIEEEQKVEPPEITLYKDTFFVAVNQEISLQDDIIQSISGEQIEDVTLVVADTGKSDILTINDLTGEQEKNGVPAKSLSFSEEGDFSVDITAIDINGNETTVTVDFEVGNELLSYVEGIHKWTVEQNAEDIDFLKDITWNKDYVESVTADSSKVDLTKTGKYILTYKVTATEKLKQITEEVEVDVEVIDKTTAQKEADNGVQVTTSGGEVKKTSSGEIPTGNVSSSNSNKSVSNSGNTSNKNSGGNSAGNKRPTSGGSNSSGSNGSGGSSNSKPSGGNSENSGSLGNSGNSGNSGGSGSVDTHKHSYTIPITETVHHDAITHQEDQGHYETVTISEAWDETKVVGYKSVCNKCGQDYNGSMNHYNTYGCKSTSYTSNVPITEIIHHDAVTEQQWVENWVTVVDKEAWDETVTVGYKCSCGAKQK